MTSEDEKKADYMVVVVDEFAQRHGIGARDAYFRLRECGAVSAVLDEYEIEHTLPLSSTMEAIEAMERRRMAAS